MLQVPYSGELMTEKTFANVGFVAIRKVFSAKLGGVASLGTAPVSNPRKFSPRKPYFRQIA